MNNVNLKWMKRINACPTQPDSCITTVAVSDVHDEFLLEKVRRELALCSKKSRRPITTAPAKISPQEYESRHIRQLIAQWNKGPEESGAKNNVITEESLREASNSWEAEPIINLVESLLDDALRQGATDIHLEPDENELRIRFRKDGLLEEYKRLPLWTADPILVRLKILASIDITDKRIPHDGGFSYNGLQDSANIRVSTLPVQGGEKCVLRLLPQKKEFSDFDKGLDSLHFSFLITKFVRNVFNNPQGLFLVTGPTGSGKTTTLHRGLQEIIPKKINVITIEDPVEYSLKGANQVQVNEKCGFTFASALRSILRQDPDVILVGEIRDEETAQIAIRAAQTGHLVLSTLHTNNAKAAFSRLLDLGISPKMLDDSLLGILAQRLVRLKSGGRKAIVELLKPDGRYVDGSLAEDARRQVQQGAIDENEAQRVLGNLYYIDGHEDF